MNQDKDKMLYVFDTSALLTFIEDEEGADEVESLLVKAETGDVEIYITFITITEVFYITIQERDEDEALRRIKLIQSLKVKIVESYEDLNLNAGKLKAANRISLADSYIAALCREYKGILVHKDPEFEKMLSPIETQCLPYKFPKASG